jgi:hypothetical protein
MRRTRALEALGGKTDTLAVPAMCQVCLLLAAVRKLLTSANSTLLPVLLRAKSTVEFVLCARS